MVGLSCHNPLEVEYAEEKAWDVDYYMTSHTGGSQRLWCARVRSALHG
jgi:thiamine monophosphate synthase